MRIFLQDLQFGLRLLKNSPGFTAVAVLTLALGIAVNTTVFSWVDSVLLNPIAGAQESDRLAAIETVSSSGENLVNTSYLDYRTYRDNLRLVSGLAVARFTPLSIGADGKTDRAWAELVSANYFDLLRVKPVLGRAFLPEEGGDQPGAYPVAIISHAMWKDRYRGDPKILGKTIRINRNELTIVGVAPAEFHGSTAGVLYDVWMPITMATAMGTGKGTLTFRGTRDLTNTIARLKPGVTIEQLRAEVSALAKRLATAHPDTNRDVEATVVPLWGAHFGAQGLLLTPLRILMVVCLLMLLIVCANVGNLLLARAVARQREFGIRLAIGARPGRLVRQLLTETLLLSMAGGAVGVILMMWMVQSLGALFPPMDVNIALSSGVKPLTLAYTMLIAFVATLISGTAPALISARGDLNQTLKEGGRSGGPGTRSHRLRGLLVVTEVALATVALIGAGLFFRSFQNASNVRPGFDMANVSASQFYLSYAGYSGKEQRLFCRALRSRLETIPGVTAVSYSDMIPLTGSAPWHQVDFEGGDRFMVHRASISPGYLSLMNIPLLEGRDFTERDDEQAPMTMIVNETFARRYLHTAVPIGRKVKIEGKDLTVVGLAKDSKYQSRLEVATPFFYVPFRQRFAPGLNFIFFVKTTGDPMLLAPIMRREALTLNQDAVFKTRMLSEAASFSLYPQKVAATLLGVVGCASLLLAAIGLYCVMSYAVSQRTKEIGIRLALGARPIQALGLVVRDGILLAAPGLFLGLVSGWAASRLVSGMLVQVNPYDPLTFGASAAFLGVVAIAATFVPGIKATRVDPITALHCE